VRRIEQSQKDRTTNSFS